MKIADTASGAKAERPGLASAFDHLRDGDTLVVWRLDRLGRSLRHKPRHDLPNTYGLQHITDQNLPDILEGACAVLILTRADCSYCASYLAAVAALLAGGQLGAVRVGVVVLDQPGVLQFKRDHPWIARLTFLPYHLLYRASQPVDGFATSRATYLARRVETVFSAPATLPTITGGDLPC